MKNQIISVDDEKIKVFGFSDERIILSSKKHKTFESLENSIEDSGMLETLKVIHVNTVKELVFNEKAETIIIKYELEGKDKKEEILLDDVSIREDLVAEMAGLKGFQKTVADESKTKPLLFNLLISVAIPIFTWFARGLAINAENGEEYVATGRRSGIKNLVVGIIETIGPTGITVIGILGFAYMAYITYKRYTNPASEVTYS